MDENKLSVIVPVYMVEEYLAECIESIIHQTYTNLEIILVDDGTKDTGGKICDEYQEKDQRIIVIHKENGGLSSARNAGIERATGKYITFVDSDDYLMPDMYQKMMDVMQKYKTDAVCCDFATDNQNAQESSVTDTEVLSKEKAISHMLDESGYKCYAWNKIFKLSDYEGIRYPQGRFYEDIYTTFRLFLKADAIGYLKEPLYRYRYRENSITNEAFTDRKYDLIFAIDSLLQDDAIRELGLYKAVLPGYIRYYFYFINSAMRSNKNIDKEQKRLRRFIFKNYFKIVTSRQITMKVFMQCTCFILGPGLYKKLLLKVKPIG